MNDTVSIFTHTNVFNYEGNLVTYSTVTGNSQMDVRRINAMIHSVCLQAGVPRSAIYVNPNRDITINHTGAVCFDNLFLSVGNRTEKSKTSLDTVISYLVGLLAQHGYIYVGEIAGIDDSRYWKLRVNNGEVHRIDGKVKVVYDETNEYQVGGIAL